MTADRIDPQSTGSVATQSMLGDHPLVTDADYHSFVDADDRLRAALIVLLDSSRLALRAELYFHGPQAVPVQNQVVGLAQTIVRDEYSGVAETTLLEILGCEPNPYPVRVRHSHTSTTAAPPKQRKGFELWQITVGLVLFILIVYLISQVGRSIQSPQAPPQPATQAVGESTAAQTVDSKQLAAEASGGDAAAPPEDSNLEESRFADKRIGINSKVRILPNLQSYVRTLPGADQGEELGFLQNGETATVIGGPVWLQGDTDTIVWWSVKLDKDGTAGWTPANTSQQQLLEVVE